jgi:hypothetical protein
VHLENIRYLIATQTKEKDMTKQRRFAGAWMVGMVGLALALVVFLGAPGLAQTAKPAGAYRLSLEAPSH